MLCGALWWLVRPTINRDSLFLNFKLSSSFGLGQFLFRNDSSQLMVNRTHNHAITTTYCWWMGKTDPKFDICRMQLHVIFPTTIYLSYYYLSFLLLFIFLTTIYLSLLSLLGNMYSIQWSTISFVLYYSPHIKLLRLIFYRYLLFLIEWKYMWMYRPTCRESWKRFFWSLQFLKTIYIHFWHTIKLDELAG